MIKQKTTAGGEAVFVLAANSLHGLVVPVGPPDVPIVAHIFGDVEGVQHMIGQPGEQRVRAQVTYTGFASYAAAMTWHNTLYRKAGQLTGEIIVTGSSANWTSPPATFLGFAPTEAPFPDGSGVHGYVLRGLLLWTVRGPSVPTPPPAA